VAFTEAAKAQPAVAAAYLSFILSKSSSREELLREDRVGKVATLALLLYNVQVSLLVDLRLEQKY
jgi:hypothetical protein